jgi:hypothetical protein
MKHKALSASHLLLLCALPLPSAAKAFVDFSTHHVCSPFLAKNIVDFGV